MRRRSNRTTHGPSIDSPIDDLVNDRRLPLSRPKSPIEPGSIRARALKQIEDRRRWGPGRKVFSEHRDPARDTSGRHARIVYKRRVAKVVSKQTSRNQFQPARKVTRWAESAVPHFHEARRTYICLKRAVRKQVLFALRRTGKGSKSPKRRNEWSNIQCSTH